jgi:hypothetical protein
MLAVVALAALSAQPAAAQQPGRNTVESRPQPATRGAPELPAEKLNVQGETTPAPESKGGSKTRGAACGVIHVDNRTDLIIRLYANGEFIGTVSKWGDAYGSYCGPIRFEAAAFFTDGSVLRWNPTTWNFNYGNFTWTLSR